MNRLVGLALGAALVAASPAYSCCLFSKCSGSAASAKGNDCATAAAPCATATVAAAPAVAAPAITYVDQQVTTYECVTKTRKVEV